MSTGRREELNMLDSSDVYATIPASDLERAKAFYADKLGLKPSEERPEGLRYRCGNGGFLLFESSGAASGDHTQIGWDVDDVEATVEELRDRGVVFEEYDLPGFKTVNGIAEIAGEKGAWFKDSEGNLLSIGQSIG
jgi:catechol 2,3-dioxygenase-like lactoylglutathione lyase family enzyme